MNILFVHEIDWLKKVVFELHHLSELLSIFGHKIFAIDYENEWTKRSFFDFGSFRTRRFENVHRAYEDASVTLNRPGFVKILGLSRASAFFTHYLNIKNIIKKELIDVIILYSIPTNGLQTIRLANKKRIPVLFRSIDILHQMVPISLLRYPTYLLERKVYSEVDKILVLTHKLANYVCSMGAKREKVVSLPPGVDTTMFFPKSNCEKIKDRYNIKDKEKIIIFMGTLFNFSGVDQYIENFPKILKDVPDAHLLIVGGGPLLDKIKKMVSNLKIQRYVTITGFQPYYQMPDFINMADICINPFEITEATREIIPTKILQYLACAKPVISTPLPGMRDMLPNEEYGVVYAKNMRELIHKSIFLLQNENLAQRLGKNGFRYVHKNHEWKGVARKLEKILFDNNA